jgi:uncharacterized membrane protein HdeD (DUF308 family)
VTVEEARARIGFLLVMSGLLVQLAASFFWSPGTFILAVALGIPLVAAGVVVLWSAVRRARRQEGTEGQ